MKTKVLLLALVTFFALCGNGFAVDKKQIGAQLQELYGQMAVLESAWMSIVNEGQAVAQEAKKVFADADKVLKTTKKDNLMCSDALAIYQSLPSNTSMSYFAKYTLFVYFSKSSLSYCRVLRSVA